MDLMLTNETVDQNLVELVSVLRDASDDFIIDFLKSILSPKECNDLASRWIIVKMLNEKMVQRDIAQKLGVSLCKITRGSRELKKINSPLRQSLLKIAPRTLENKALV
jgi:TrpR family trp operon transcriptional repressor